MRRWLPVLWYGLIFISSATVISQRSFLRSVGSVLPSDQARGTLHNLWLAGWWVIVKGWHATEFAILFLLIHRVVKDVRWCLILVAIAASLDEYHQTFVPDRGGRLTDVLIDIGGALVAAIILKWRSAPQHSKNAQLSAT